MIWFSAITLVFLCGPQLGFAQPVAYSDKLGYDDALAACEAKGMMLAKDISESKHELIKEEIKAKGLDEMDFWINGKVNSDGDWVSSDGDHSTSYRPWAIFEPNGSGSCLQLRRGSGYAWDDDKCVVAKGYVCEPIEDESDRPIAFAEKLSFDEALASCTSKGMVLASDTSSVKHTLLVDELKSKGMDGEDFWINGKLDNNGDWMTSDGHHLTSYQPWAIFEPNGSGSCLTLWAHLGYAWDDTGCDVEKYYICEPAVLPEDMPVAFSDRLSHAGAEASCKTKGMILAKDISDTKHALLVGVLLKSGLKSQDAWINGQLASDNVWKTNDGEPLDSFQPWAAGEPSGNGRCIQLWSGREYKWDDDECVVTKAYICEKEAIQPPPKTQAPPPPKTQAPPPPKTEAPPPPEATMIPTTLACEFPANLVNVAQGKSTSQSSTKPRVEGTADKAVDGNKDSDMKKGKSCTQTNKEFQPWWKVDLRESKGIYKVVITNRQDCCPFRIRNAQVRVGDSPNMEENPVCGSMVLGKRVRQETITVTCGCETPMTGRYVSIQLIDKEQTLHLCEVEVMVQG
ncbi:C-type mannose receptor 2-like [Ptychodera flava]|uniref:C-type mannose receptor 2-like n=1 Tax=Ptychodera flava TaxID=63121 RepID=UPI00396A3614